MADNLKGIPFSSEDEGIDFPQMARDLVQSQATSLGVNVRADEVYIVWFAFVLGNFKAICSTPETDGRIYEVTYSKRHSVAYVDTYRKTHNIEIDIDKRAREI